MSLRKFNLNLLPILEVLVEERNISRSAAKLSMSQPAVSHALSRLRQQFDDPILVRVGSGMQPSPKALQIHQQLQGALKQIEQTVFPSEHFTPASSNRKFSVATTDYVEALLLPPLLSRLQEQAPGVELQIRELTSRLPLEDIESGVVDLAIGRGGKIPQRFQSQVLLQDGYLCAVSADHALAGKQLTFEQYSKLEHLLVVPASQRRELAKSLFSDSKNMPKIVANIPHFLAALHAVSESNTIVTGPARLLQKFEQPFNLHLMELPFALEPFQILLVWHQFKTADRGLAWLREQLEAVV